MGNPIQPGTVTTIISTTTSSIGHSATTSTDFTIIVKEGILKFYTKSGEVTGDGDSVPKFQNSGLRYGRWLLRGIAIASHAIGIAALNTTTQNPMGSIGFVIGGGRKIISSATLVNDITIHWRKNAVYVGVDMDCHLTGTITESAS